MYENATKEELVDKIKQLERHVEQLKNVIAKSNTCSGGKAQRKQRPFDFTKYNTRHVALKIAYLGWDYQGFAVQEDTEKTIEAVLFDALLRTRLIESRATSNYHRCGRTDKGVSAFSQVISIDLRTNLSRGIGVKCRENGPGSSKYSPSSVVEEGQTDGSDTQPEEIRYVYILNRVLPAEIRVLAWTPVDPSFSARFSCTSRTYKYFFPRGDLDLSRMQEATGALIGEHDFRNLCKMDVANGVVTYRRHITAVDLDVRCQKQLESAWNYPAGDVGSDANQQANVPDSEAVLNSDVEERGFDYDDDDDGYEICELTITGQAFLWHQIRCIVAILFLIGQGRENPGIISELLDVERHPCKPQYTMAAEFPLVLFDCAYYNDGIEWRRDADSDVDVVRSLQTSWTRHAVRAAMLRRMLLQLGSSDRHQADGLVAGSRCRTYKPLFERESCQSLRDRIGHYAKKQKLSFMQTAATPPPPHVSDTQ